MKKTAAILIVLSVLVFTAFTFPGPQKQQTSSFKSYSISFPDDWVKSEQKNTKGAGETFYLYSSPKDEDGNKMDISVIVSKSVNDSPDDYAQKLLMNYGKQFGDFELSHKNQLKIHDVPYASFRIHHKGNGKDYISWVVFTMKEGVLYQMIAMAPEKTFEKKFKAAESIVGSFKIIEFKS